MNTKVINQKMLKKAIKINSKDYLNYLMNNFKKNKNQITGESLKSFLIPDKYKDFLSPNINIDKISNNINNKKIKQINIYPTDPRLIYCIKMLGIVKYYSNFAQKKLNFEGFLALTNEDMALINIPKNIQKLVQKFILDYLNFGSHYTLDEIKSFFSYKKSLINHKNNERTSFSNDFNNNKLSERNKVNNNINNPNKYMMQKRNIINNFISEDDKRIKNNIINRNKRENTRNINNRRINKSASPSHKKYFNNYSNIQMNNYNEYQNNININNINEFRQTNNLNGYYNNINNNCKNKNMRKTYSFNGHLFNNIDNFSYENLNNNFNNLNFNLIKNNPINMTEIKQNKHQFINNNINQNINEFQRLNKKNRIKSNSNNQLIKKKI